MCHVYKGNTLVTTIVNKLQFLKIWNYLQASEIPVVHTIRSNFGNSLVEHRDKVLYLGERKPTEYKTVYY